MLDWEHWLYRHKFYLFCNLYLLILLRNIFWGVTFSTVPSVETSIYWFPRFRQRAFLVLFADILLGVAVCLQRRSTKKRRDVMSAGSFVMRKFLSILRFVVSCLKRVLCCLRGHKGVDSLPFTVHDNGIDSRRHFNTSECNRLYLFQIFSVWNIRRSWGKGECSVAPGRASKWEGGGGGGIRWKRDSQETA